MDKCPSCRWFSEWNWFGTGVVSGYCHRRSPVVSNAAARDWEFNSTYPKVTEDNFCGEHEVK